MKTFTLTLGLFLFISAAIFAAPAYPGLIKKVQPTGAELSLYIRGDEKVHWMESEDGYSLLYDADKYIVYATADEENNMVPSSIVAQDVLLRSATLNNQLKNIPKGLKYSSAQINTLNGIWNLKRNLISHSSGLRATTGNAKTVCALIEFPDANNTHKLVKTKADFDMLMNQTGYNANGAKGSVKDFYLENSYNQLNLTVTITGPFIAKKNWAYYGENNTTDSFDKYPDELAIEAADATFNDLSINPADYDNDGDGYIDAFHVIYAGYGEESGADANAIWAHEYGFTERTYRTKKLDTYSCSPELRGNSSSNPGSNITHIGVICHEFGHVFGAPDFYDSDGTGSGGEFRGTGYWDLMANGSWNGPGRDGSSPAHINMYQKIKFEWVNSVVLNMPQQINNMLNSAQNAVAYTYNTTTPGEYFVLENRQQEGFDAYIPGHGLLIYRVSITDWDLGNAKVNTGHPQKVYPVYAASSLSLPTGSVDSYGTLNSAGCPFPGSSGKTSFSDFTTPAAKAWNGTNTGKSITNITEESKKISFQFSQTGVLPVTNLQFSRQLSNITLTWDKPNEEALKYNIYRNNQILITLMGINSLSYIDNSVGSGNYDYCVTAVYAGNVESEKVCIQTGDFSGIEPVPLAAKVLTYPNPIGKGELLTIETGEDTETILSFYTVSGQLIRQKQTHGTVVYEIINFAPGVYVLQIKTGLHIFNRKIVVK
jgi:M6 family metalloprotease-like protein